MTGPGWGPVSEDQIRRSMERSGMVIPEGSNLAEVVSGFVDHGYLTVVMIEDIRHYLPSEMGDEYIRLTIGESRS